jgi:pyruvate, water dikinase
MPGSIAWFADLGIADRPRAGGKGASLGELGKAGAAVPPGFVLTASAFETFLAAFDSSGTIRSSIAGLAGASAEAIAVASAEIRAALEAAPLQVDLQHALDTAYTTLSASARDLPVAVRSSATSEDSADASFAGMQDTFLWVTGVDAVITAVKRCWSSLYSVESITYRLRLNLPESDVAMAVVVQAMVDARCAGVLFTRSPLTGDRSVMVLEAAYGLGSSVVGGEVTPDRFVVSKVTGEIVKRDVSRKTVQHVPDLALRRVVDRPVPDALQTQPCLSDAEISALAASGKRLEKHYGHAQDIEWAVAQGGEILFLQARPETVWSARDAAKAAAAPPPGDPMEHVMAALVNRGKTP